jgi:hypothetical protein
MIPKTAGRLVTESELRAYTKCSEFHNFGGTVDPEARTRIIAWAYERLVVEWLRKSLYDPLDTINKYLQEAVKRDANELLQQQQQELVRHGILILNDIFSLMPPDLYTPVFGPYEYTVKLSKTAVQLRISAAFRSTKNQTLHIVCFSPYLNQHAVMNDPVVHLKLATVKNAVKPHGQRAQARIHLFSVSPTGSLVYNNLDTEEANPEFMKHIVRLVKRMEAGHHFPLVPCPHTCQFKKQCMPLGANNERS